MTLPGSPSLVCREKNDPGAWRSSSPRRRVVMCQMILRDDRIALLLKGERWHACCWRSVVIPAVRIRGPSSVSRAKGLLRAPTNTNPAPKRHRTTATLSKGRHSVNPCRSGAGALIGHRLPPSHSPGAHSYRVRSRGDCHPEAQVNDRPAGARDRRRSPPRRLVVEPRSGRVPVAPGRGGDGRAAR
jgi:hypothetical protein